MTKASSSSFWSWRRPRVLYLLIPRRRTPPSTPPCRVRRGRSGRVNNCRRNSPELCRPLSKSDKINHASRGHARCGCIHLSHPLAQYPVGFVVDKGDEGGRWHPSGNQRKMHCDLEGHATPLTRHLFLTHPLVLSYFFATRIRLFLVFRRSNTGWIGSTRGTENERVEKRTKRRRRRRRRIGAFAEEVDAAMHWRRRVKLSFSHNSLESSPLNSVIGCAIGTRMRYRLRWEKKMIFKLSHWHEFFSVKFFMSVFSVYL